MVQEYTNEKVAPNLGLSKSFTFHVPTRILFGTGLHASVLPEATRIGGRKIFFVTDAGIEKAGIADKVRSVLKKKFEVETFNEIEAEPSLDVAEATARAVRQDHFDLVVGVGGGSSLDMAKVGSAMAANAGNVADYSTRIFNVDVFTRRGLPTILMPTTAGTGSEVSPTSVISIKGTKVMLTGSTLIPDVAVVDPLLTLSVPPKVTASTGLDALAHAIEGMLSTDANDLTDALALKGIEMIAGNLPRAYGQGDDVEARSAMSLAALIGGLVLYAKMVYGHSIAYTIAKRYALPHGVSTSIPLPYVMEYNLRERREKMARIASAFGESAKGLAEDEAAYKAIFATRRLIQSVGVPTTLQEIGVRKEVVPSLAEECLTYYPRPNSPRPMGKEEAIALYERIWEGKLGPGG